MSPAALIKHHRATVVHAPELVEILLDRKQLLILRAFMCCDGQTIKAASEELQLDLNLVYKRVTRYERLGLLRVVREQARRGRKIKVYACVDERFFIPVSTYPLNEYFNDLLRPFLESLNLNFHQVFEHAAKPVGGLLAGDLRLGGTTGGYYSLADQSMEPFEDFGADTPPAVFQFVPVSLSRTAARALEEELTQLFMKYSGQGGPERYMLGSFLFPIYRNLNNDP